MTLLLQLEQQCLFNSIHLTVSTTCQDLLFIFSLYTLSLQLDYKPSEKRDLISYHLLLLVTEISVMHFVASRTLPLMMKTALYVMGWVKRHNTPSMGSTGDTLRRQNFLDRLTGGNNVVVKSGMLVGERRGWRRLCKQS